MMNLDCARACVFSEAGTPTADRNVGKGVPGPAQLPYQVKWGDCLRCWTSKTGLKADAAPSARTVSPLGGLRASRAAARLGGASAARAGPAQRKTSAKAESCGRCR